MRLTGPFETDVPPVFAGMELNVVTDRIHNVVVTSENIRGNGNIIVTYDPAYLEVHDLSTLTFERALTVGVIPGTDIEITRFDPNNGIIQFRVNSDIPVDTVFSGVLNIIAFRARRDGTTFIRISEEVI